MRYLFLPAALVVSLLSLALLTPAVHAKGPVSLVIRGGELPQPIRIDGPLDIAGLFQNPHSFPASFNPKPAPAYLVDIYPLKDGVPAGSPEATLTYFPASAGQPGLLRVQGGDYMIINSKLMREVDDRIAAVLGKSPAAAASAAPAEASAPGGGTSAMWYVLPGLALGLVLIGGGLAGLRLRQRKIV